MRVCPSPSDEDKDVVLLVKECLGCGIQKQTSNTKYIKEVKTSTKDEESSSTIAQSQPRLSISVSALRHHAGKVIPGLWVGDIRSVSFIKNLVRLSIKRYHLDDAKGNTGEQKANATVTVISVMSSVNLLKYVADLLGKKHKLFEENKQLQIDGDANQQPLE